MIAWPFGDLPRNSYGVLAVDPPWHFRAGVNRRHTSTHYPTMPMSEICALPIADLAAPDCALFLWTTPPFLKASIEVMDAWRFRYVSIAFTWLKLKKGFVDALWFDGDVFIGLGHTTRKGSELCLLGKRGKPKRLALDVHEVIVAARREHSRKPDEMYRRALRLYPGPHLELFAREQRPGWSSWGNEVEKFTENVE